jgi:prepilin-type N-terminal cleavage/methylation domain-containing protein
MIDMKKLIKNKKGFTLIELIVVIAILAVLAAILIPSIMNYVAQARTARNDSNARALYSEVSAGVAMGTITADDSITEGGITCNYEVTDGVLDSFDCSVDDDADGTLTVTFSP